MSSTSSSSSSTAAGSLNPTAPGGAPTNQTREDSHSSTPPPAYHLQELPTRSSSGETELHLHIHDYTAANGSRPDTPHAATTASPPQPGEGGSFIFSGSASPLEDEEENSLVQSLESARAYAARIEHALNEKRKARAKEKEQELMTNGQATVLPVATGTKLTEEGQSQQQARPAKTFWYKTKSFLRKFKGQGVESSPMHPFFDIFYYSCLALLGIAVPAALNFNMFYALDNTTDMLIFASLGASAVLIYSVPLSDLAQPRNVIGGHFVSSLVGVCVRHLIYPSSSQVFSTTDSYFLHIEWFGCALAVSLAICAQNLTKTLHPPGGATALTAILPSASIQNLDWKYIAYITSSATIMCIIAAVGHNLRRKRVYPKFWIGNELPGQNVIY